MGGAVPIRPVNQSIETPSPGLPSNPLHAEPIESSAGPALSDVGKSLFGIWQVQQDHANAIQTAQAKSSFAIDMGNLRNDTLTNPDPTAEMDAHAMSKHFQDSANGLVDAYINNPAYSPLVRQQLAVDLRQEVASHLQSFPIDATEQVHHNIDFRMQQQNAIAANVVGQHYTVGPDGTPQLDDIGKKAMDDHQALIAQGTQGWPQQTKLYQDQFAQLSAREGAMSIASDPARVTQLPAFLNAPAISNVLTAQEKITAKNTANETMDGGMRQIEVDGKAGEANLYNTLLDQKAKGILSDSVVIQAVSNGIQPAPGKPFVKLAPELGAQLIGQQKIAQIEPPTIPSVYNAVKQSLDMAPNDEAAQLILAGAGTKGSGINSTDTAKLRVYWAAAKPTLDDPVTSAVREYGGAGGWIDQQYRHLDESYVDSVGNSLNPAIQTNRLAAKNHFVANAKMIDDEMKSQGKGTSERLEALRKFAADTVKTYQPPASALISVSPDHRAAVMALPPPIRAKFDPNRDGMPTTSIAPGK